MNSKTRRRGAASSKGRRARQSRTSKKELKRRTLTAVVMITTAGLLIAGTVARVSKGLATGESFHIPLVGLLLIVGVFLAGIWSIIEWVRAMRGRK